MADFNFLDLLTPVRRARAAAQERETGDLANEARRLGIETVQREHADQERARLVAAQRGAVGALRLARDRGQDVGGVFDQIAPALPAMGVPAESLAELRSRVTQDPAAIDTLEQFLQDPEQALSRQRLSLEGRRLDQSDERIGQGAARIGLGERTLEQRAHENDPTTIQEQSRGRSLGTSQGEVAASLPALRSRTNTATERIDSLLENPSLDSIFGLPSLSALSTGGFGAQGVIDGSPAADALAELNLVVGDSKAAALSLLEGQTPVSDADREAVAASIANLDRTQSPASALRSLRALRAVLERALASAEETTQTTLPALRRPAARVSSQSRASEDLSDEQLLELYQ